MEKNCYAFQALFNAVFDILSPFPKSTVTLLLIRSGIDPYEVILICFSIGFDDFVKIHEHVNLSSSIFSKTGSQHKSSRGFADDIMLVAS